MMATSSIIENIRINNPKVIEAYVEAVEAAENAPVARQSEPLAKEVTDPDKIREMMLRNIEKWGKKSR